MIAWSGNLEIMKEDRLAKKITEWKTVACRQKGRSRMRWEDVKRDLKVMKFCNWKFKLQVGMNGNR
jgi:hypothetical protein